MPVRLMIYWEVALIVSFDMAWNEHPSSFVRLPPLFRSISGTAGDSLDPTKATAVPNFRGPRIFVHRVPEDCGDRHS